MEHNILEGRDYRDLNLNRDNIVPTVTSFAGSNALNIRNIVDRPGGPGMRVLIGKAGIEDATVDIYFTTTGSSTIQFKTGRNHPLGEALADSLYETIHPDEFKSINLSLKGITFDDISTIISQLTEQPGAEVFIADHGKNKNSTMWKLKSKSNQDEITVHQHGTTNTLQIQGRPLSCYRELTYLTADLLDLNALECILFKKDDNRSEVIRSEVAEQFLSQKLGACVERLPEATKKLLLSGLCVQLASPALPDYCMLLYPELRSLEGAIRQRLAENNLEDQEDSFGCFFDKANGRFTLKQEYHDSIKDAKIVAILGDAYTFFNKHRHGLFHMEAQPDGSRMLSNFTQLLTLSDKAYEHLTKLYS